jgi:hypothetical protein
MDIDRSSGRMGIIEKTIHDVGVNVAELLMLESSR